MKNKETLEEVRKVERTELFNSIFSVVKQIPRKDVECDAMDASSCSYEIEQLFYKWQQEQEKITTDDAYNEGFENGKHSQEENLDCPFDFTSRCTLGRCDCKSKQETLEEITEQIQKDCHKFVESIISKVTYQDATNTFLFMKLAELTLKLKKYE